MSEDKLNRKRRRKQASKNKKQTVVYVLKEKLPYLMRTRIGSGSEFAKGHGRTPVK